MNIRNINLGYNGRSQNNNRVYRDLFRDAWSETKSVFTNEALTSIVLIVGFGAVDDPQECIFERFESS